MRRQDECATEHFCSSKGPDESMELVSAAPESVVVSKEALVRGGCWCFDGLSTVTCQICSRGIFLRQCGNTTTGARIHANWCIAYGLDLLTAI